MAIVKMKRLNIIVPAENKRRVLRAVTRLGCVELESCTQQRLAEFGGSLFMDEQETQSARAQASLKAAYRLLEGVAPWKSSFLQPRPQLTEQQLFDQTALQEAQTIAQAIERHGKRMADAAARQTQLQMRLTALAPWQTLELPFDWQGTENTVFWCGVLPAAVDLTALEQTLAAQAPACALQRVSGDNEQHYCTVLAHRQQAEQAMAVLRPAGFVQLSQREGAGTAAEQMAQLRGEMAQLAAQKAEDEAAIAAFAPRHELLERGIDALAAETARDGVLAATGRTKSTVLFTGWAPETAQQSLAPVLEQYSCAYEFLDPQPDEQPPTAYQNSKWVQPFGAITDMYGTSEYHSIIDPNPWVSLFYFIFFGFIMADVVYGIILFAACYIYLKKKRPSGGTKNMLTLFMYCGISTMVAGVLTGGWLSDAAQAVSAWATGGAGFAIAPLWFNPMDDPLRMMVFTIVLGVIQMFIGMWLSAWRLIRQGKPLDALFDVGSWYFIFIGLGLFAGLGIRFGMYLAIGGVLLLVLTGGRESPSILGKITGGLGKIYGITSYLSDLLSYTRIMALGLAGAVIGQVVNKLATMGTGIPGAILFVLIFLGGHAFNLVISLLGAYVHTGRLQYLEFFGRFFADGGRPFEPLENHTQYVEIIKED